MAVNFSTNTYSGEVLEDLISHAVQGNDTMNEGLVHVKSGIQHKYVLPTIKLGEIIQDNVATPVSPTNSKGTYTLGERYLEPEEFMVYLEFNPRDFEEYWRPFQPTGNLVFRELDPFVQTKMLRLLIERKNEYLGESIWMSTKGGGTAAYTGPVGLNALGTGMNKYHQGFMARLLDSIKSGVGTEKVISAGTTALDTGAKVEAALYAIWKQFPKQLRKSRKLKFVMDMEIWDLYDEYLTAKDVKYKENKDVNEHKFKGKPIIPINGMPEQTIVLAELSTGADSNFWMGVDYANDTEVVKIDQLQSNSELYFFQMRMKIDVNIVKPGEIAVHTPWVPV